MDIPQGIAQQKKLADLRKQITPDGDDEHEQEVHQIYSDQQSSPQDQTTPATRILPQNNPLGEEEEKWEDTPNREYGETQALEPLAQPKLSQEKKEEPQQKPATDQKNNQEKTKKKLRFQQKEVKSFGLGVDSKYIYAAFYLLRDDFKAAIKPQDGFVKLNPYINSKQIRIFYYDENKRDEIAQIVENCIHQLQVIQMTKTDAQSGIQLSYKYYQNLLKQKITFFKDRTQNFKTISYYICGKVNSKKILYQKLSQIKKYNFIWMHLYRYENTRSYRAILRKIFDTSEVREFILQRFKSKQIQVAYTHKDCSLPENSINKNGVMIVMTIIGQKKISIHQEIEQNISTFIQKTFAVFCFCFNRKKESFENRFTPKVDNVIWFFIAERNTYIPTSYLYIIVNKKNFEAVKQTIIKEIESMKLEIFGRRFFKSICPERPQKINHSQHCLYGYPKSYPYSWTLRAKRDTKFDWIAELKIQ